MGDSGHHGFIVQENDDNSGKYKGMVDIFFDPDQDYRPERKKNWCCIYSCVDPNDAIDFLEKMIKSAQEEIDKIKGDSKFMKQKQVIKKVVKKEIIKKDDSRYLCSLVENAETQLIQEEMQGQIIDKLAYHFVTKNKFTGEIKKVDGLTFWGLLACAKDCKDNKKRNIFKWIPEWTKPEYDKLDDVMILLTIGCKNPKDKRMEWGTCTFNPKERFAERTALTNAKRYALDKHIDVQQKVLFIQYLKEHKPKSILQIESGEDFKAKPTIFVVSDSGKVKQTAIKEKPEDKQIEKIGGETFL